MRIKSYKTKRFAGLKDMDVEFSEGLNVILGKNESGKSTIIDGIHSTLFKNIRLRKNNNLDKDFTFKYMPKPKGDFIDGKVKIKVEDKEYEIYKEWGSKETIQFIDSDGSIVKNEKDINSQMLKLLTYGESTYSSIVFAKQRDLKIALNNIISNSQVTDEVNDLLRKTMMELEGVSIDKIQKDIEDQIETLYKRWDRDKGYPQNNRGANNPYKTGLGKILENYYKKENLLSLMEETGKSEKEFEDICQKIKFLEERVEPLKEKKEELEKIEGDVNNRAIAEIKIHALEGELEDLLEANKNWPKTEQILEQYDEKLASLKEEKKNLDKEKENIDKLAKREKLEKKLESIEKIDFRKQEIADQLKDIKEITSKDIEKLTQVQTETLTLETTIKASKMVGVLKKKSQGQIYIAKDFGEKEVLQLSETFQANGIINISCKDGFELEIKTASIDFEQLNDSYKSCKANFKELLNELGLETLEEAKLKLAERKRLQDENKSLDNQRQFILEDTRKETLQEKIKQLQNIKSIRTLEDIEELVEKNRDKELDLSSKKIGESERLEKWKEKYGDYDSLLDLVIDKKTSLKQEKASLQTLKPLPEEFNRAEEFKEKLVDIREELKEKQEELEQLKPLFYDSKSKMLDLSFEEVQREYKQAQKHFDNNLKRGEKFLKIQEVFLQTKEELSNNPMETLVNEFARLLETITQGDYKKSDIDEEFNIKLENNNGQIPIELLSAGTYDSVTLALRFALLKHIFNEKKGYVVLDDCLVDLDPIRKEQSVRLINEFAKDYQIIFTTCDPQTANMLGGNIIEL